MVTNVVQAVLNETDKYFESETLFAKNYGNAIAFVGVELPVYFEVHFAKKEHGESITMIGENNIVEIPDELIQDGDHVFAWIFLHTGANDGETMCTVRIPVIRRADITNTEPTPVQQDIIEQAIAALDSGIQHVDQVAQDMQTDIEAALREAKASGEFDGPPGPEGPRGPSGVYIGASEPTEPGINVWIDPAGTDNVRLAREGVF